MPEYSKSSKPLNTASNRERAKLKEMSKARDPEFRRAYANRANKNIMAGSGDEMDMTRYPTPGREVRYN